MRVRPVQIRSENSRALALAAITVAVAGLTGCSSRLVYRDQGPVAGDQGEAWEVVLSGPLASAEAGDEYARLDERMGRREGSIYPLDMWPEQPLPALERSRRLSLPTNPNSVQYFLNSRRDSSYDWYWYGY